MSMQSHPGDYTRAEKIAMTVAALGIEFTPRTRPEDRMRAAQARQLARLHAQNRGLNHLDQYLPAHFRRKAGVIARSRRQLTSVLACAYCNKVGSTGTGPDGKVWHMDHVEPLSQGGNDHESNIVKACARCNMKKSSTRAYPPIGTPTGDGATWQGPDSPPLWLPHQDVR